MIEGLALKRLHVSLAEREGTIVHGILRKDEDQRAIERSMMLLLLLLTPCHEGTAWVATAELVRFTVQDSRRSKKGKCSSRQPAREGGSTRRRAEGRGRC